MNSTKRRHFDPTTHFKLNDICLWTTSLTRSDVEQEEQKVGRATIQTFQKTSPNIFEVETEGGEKANLLRVLVSMGLRAVDRDGEQDQQILYTLEATFAVDYLIIEAPEVADFVAFVDFNCMHNAWPFWRQHVFDTLKRASLPVVQVPFFAGKSPAVGPKKAKQKKLA
ncbi:hypothetical protein D3C81_353530 [compost metagenome]